MDIWAADQYFTIVISIKQDVGQIFYSRLPEQASSLLQESTSSPEQERK